MLIIMYLNIEALSGAGADLSSSGPLVSDSTIRRIQRTLREFSSTSIPDTKEDHIQPFRYDNSKRWNSYI